MKTTTTTSARPASGKPAPYVSIADMCRAAGITESQLAKGIAQRAIQIREEAATAPPLPSVRELAAMTPKAAAKAMRAHKASRNQQPATRQP